MNSKSIYLNLRDGMKSHYLSCPWNTSIGDWYKRWFYIREEPDDGTLCDAGYIPEKRATWSELLEDLRQVEEIVRLILWSKLDGPSVVGNFISRRMQPSQKRVHPGYEY